MLLLGGQHISARTHHLAFNHDPFVLPAYGGTCINGAEGRDHVATAQQLAGLLGAARPH